MLTIKEAAARAGVCRATIYRWLKAGMLTAYRQRTRIRIDPVQLEALCAVVPG